MKNILRRTHSHTLFTSFAFLSALTFAVACGDDPSDPPGTNPDSGGDTCTATTGTGTLTVEVNGLPAGVLANVKLTGPSGDRTITATDTNASTPAGAYTIAASLVTVADPIVRTAYSATVTRESSCIGNGTTDTLTVTYDAIATSNKLWVTNANHPSNTNLLAFTSSTIAASGSPTSAFAATADSVGHELFDHDGNLWVPTATGFAMYTAASLADPTVKTPARTITVSTLNCIPAVSGAAFDREGSLYISSPCAKAIYKIKAIDLSQTGTVAPSSSIALEGAVGLAFNSNGDLFAGAGGKLYRFDSSALLGAAPTSAFNLSASTSGPVTAAIGVDWLAFDKAGDLWVLDSNGNTLFKVPAATLGESGAKEITPTITLKIGVAALPENIALDEGGGFWLASAQGNFVRIAPEQLTASNENLTPDRVITSPDVGYAGHVAFFPAPAGLPLASSLP